MSDNLWLTFTMPLKLLWVALAGIYLEILRKGLLCLSLEVLQENNLWQLER